VSIDKVYYRLARPSRNDRKRLGHLLISLHNLVIDKILLHFMMQIGLIGMTDNAP